MKTLLILRHAKSSWNQPGLADHDRPLTKRGERDAPRMGQLLRDLDLVPDVIITSTAKRARKTAKKVAQASGYQAGVIKTDAFYQALPEDYLAVLQTLTDDYERVMVIGHNPTLEDLVKVLTGAEEIMPTAALAQISLPIARWQDLSAGTEGELVNLWRPKMLP